MSQPTRGSNDHGEQQPQQGREPRFQQSQQSRQQHPAQRGSGPGAPPAKSKLPWIISALLLLLVLILLGFFLWPSQGEVPYVAGKPQAQAEAELRAAGLTVGAPTFNTDANQPDGVVLDTIPKPGTKTKEGEAITLVLNKNSGSPPPGGTTPPLGGVASTPTIPAPPPITIVIPPTTPGGGGSTTPPPIPKKVTVPDLIGMQMTVAENQLLKMPLQCSRFPATAGNADQVTNQFPAKGTLVDKNSMIALVGTPAKPKFPIEMPDVVGKPWSVALATLSIFGPPDFPALTENGVYDNTKPWDTVTSTNPVKGVKVPKGTPIQVTVNNEYTELPPGNLVGLEFDANMIALLTSNAKQNQGHFVVAPPSPTSPPSRIQAVKVGPAPGVTALPGQKYAWGTPLTFTFAVPTTPDFIASPLGRTYTVVKNEITSLGLGATVDPLTINNTRFVRNSASRGTVYNANSGYSVLINGVKIDNAEIKRENKLPIPKGARVTLIVEKNPAKWRIRIPSGFAKAHATTPYAVDITSGLTRGFKVQPKIGGASHGSQTDFIMTMDKITLPMGAVGIDGPATPFPPLVPPGFVQINAIDPNDWDQTPGKSLQFEMDVDVMAGGGIGRMAGVVPVGIRPRSPTGVPAAQATVAESTLTQEIKISNAAGTKSFVYYVFIQPM